ncbi:MAG TPA: glycine/sarcosine/betaine reductase selenoprotein B family protein [Pyrinomonadaceae bacterium]|jgi:D-proline reductase (dithiol) PrdB
MGLASKGPLEGEPEFDKAINAPARTRAGWLNEIWARWLSGSRLGGAFGHWVSRLISVPQLRRLAAGEIPWTPLRKPLADCTVVLLTTGGVHLRTDPPFNLNGDSTFRVIPKNARPGDLAISHQAYDRTDALRDINLVFPIERLRELEAEHVIGRLAENNYGFGLMGSAKKLMPSIKEVARRISESGVDLALLVPA